MLEFIGYKSMDQFIKSVIPPNILEQGKINLGEEKTEEEALAELKQIAAQNKVYKSFGKTRLKNYIEDFLRKKSNITQNKL